MQSLDSMARRGPVVAVIGGGASGTLTAVHLLSAASRRRMPVRIALIDRDGRHGLGKAYATTHPAHLLNTPARQMSALADDPGHLLRWAGPVRCGPDGFLPRWVYGRYLRDTLAQAQRTAQPACRVSMLTGEVIAIRHTCGGRALCLHMADGASLDADVAVLATGSLPAPPPCPVPDAASYIADPWAAGALAGTADGRDVVIAGTGLTMMDLATAITGASPKTTVYAVSRHGLLPHPHREAYPRPRCWLPAFSWTEGTVRLSELMWQVRCATADRPGDWENVVDSLRPHVPRLWQGMPVADKRLFLRHLARYWEIHRHRVPPATARKIAELRATGRLRVVPGRIAAALPERYGLRMRIETDGLPAELHAGWLINATGPGHDIAAAPSPLLRDLFASGLARPDPTSLGIDAGASGAVIGQSGQPAAGIFALGPPLRGVRYETTAISEIREQAAILSRHIVASPYVRVQGGSAA